MAAAKLLPAFRMRLQQYGINQTKDRRRLGFTSVRRPWNKRWVSSINFVNAAGLRPQDSAFIGLSNFPSFDRNHAEKERTKLSFGFF